MPEIVAPLDIVRLEARLRHHDYQVSRHLGELTSTWQGRTFTLRMMGTEDDTRLSLAASTARAWPSKRTSEVVGCCAVVNSEHFLPKLYPLLEGKTWRVRAEVVIDASQGLSDLQLDDHLGMAISACLAALEQVETILS